MCQPPEKTKPRSMPRFLCFIAVLCKNQLALRFLFGACAAGYACVVTPVVLRVGFGSVVPSVPFLFWKLMAHVAFFVENIGIFAEKKI